MISITERVFRRLIIEAGMVPNESQAALVDDHSNLKRAIIYDRSLFLRDLDFVKFNLRKGKEREETLLDFFNDIMLGFIEISPPESYSGIGYGPCADAWMVAAVAGPGYGKNVYGLGYALSPNGMLIPDRGSVKPKARNAWRSVFAKDVKKVRLDDKYHEHSEEGNEYHTDDPFDDCKLHRDPEDPQLDYAYSGTGEEEALLNKLVDNHYDAFNQIYEQSGDEDLILLAERYLRSAVAKFWKTHYFDS